MRIIEVATYRGPHLYSRTPMIRVRIDLGPDAGVDTAARPGFEGRLVAQFPGLAAHHCSLGRPGGFLERMRSGTRLGHVIEHVALELQKQAGMPTSRGKTRAVTGHHGWYDVLVSYQDPQVTRLALRIAVDVVGELAGLRPAGLDAVAPDPGTDPREALAELVRRRSLGPTTGSLVDEARRRSIPARRADDRSLIRFGQGVNQHLMRAGITDATSHLAVELAGSKQLTKERLRSAGIPVPEGVVVSSADEAVAAAASLDGGTVVTKPLSGNHGRGVSRGLRTPDDVVAGYVTAAAHGPRVVVEREILGKDHRVLVIGGRMVAAAERVPAHVVGDGSRTIAALIDELNADPRRGIGHADVLTRITVDAALEHRVGPLARVPEPGELVVLADTANLSTGGEAIDRTDEIHPDNVVLAERAARAIGLDIAGIDIIAPDLGRPIHETGGAVIEVNAAPGFRMHLAPSIGRPRDVARPAIDLLYPPGAASRIPITSVTGTNGKSTTVRMIAHLLQTAGRCVGMTNTSGVYVDGTLVRRGDASGPKSARLVLEDPLVDAAVLETARGGLLREGLAYDLADVGVVLNVSADHLGLGGVDTLGQLARVKSVIARNVRRRGMCVLNADDPRVRRMASVARGRVAWFTLQPPSSELLDAQWVAALEGGRMVLYEAGVRSDLLAVDDLPSTFGGVAAFNIPNALAAILAARGDGLSHEVIVEGLRSFETSFDQNPGRFNVTHSPGFTAIVDYAHNPAALHALGAAVTAQAARAGGGRRIGVISTPGDRRDEDIRTLGGIAARYFDELVFRERPDGRGRAAGGVVALLQEGALAAGLGESHVHIVVDETAAMDFAMRMAAPADVVAMTVTDVEGVWRQVLAFRSESVDA